MPRISAAVTSSSRVMNVVHVTFGSLTFAAGASHIVSSFCTPLMEMAADNGEPIVIDTAGNSVGAMGGPWPNAAPRIEMGSDFKSQTSAVEFL